MDKGTLIRTIILVIALVNNALVLAGHSPLPFNDAEIESFVAGAFTVAATLVAWYKNNYVTKKGQAQKEELKKKGLA